jgi:hypothetical protein
MCPPMRQKSATLFFCFRRCEEISCSASVPATRRLTPLQATNTRPHPVAMAAGPSAAGASGLKRGQVPDPGPIVQCAPLCGASDASTVQSPSTSGRLAHQASFDNGGRARTFWCVDQPEASSINGPRSNGSFRRQCWQTFAIRLLT